MTNSLTKLLLVKAAMVMVFVSAFSRVDASEISAATRNAVRILPASATVPAGNTQQFTATARGVSTRSVIWRVNGIEGGNSIIGKITSGGLFTASAAALSPSRVTITASVDASTKSAAAVRVVATNGTPPLVVSASDLPVGTVGSYYSAQLTASGGTGQQTWGVVMGNLPQGLTLSSDGTISGTPSNPGGSGVFSVCFQVWDSADPRQTAISGLVNINVGPWTSPRDYYVDGVSSSALDTNPGTMELPWKSLTPVHNTVFQPGDTIHFKRGGNWAGPLVIANSGASGLPITFTDYGETSAAAPTFSNPGVSYGHVIEINASWVVVENVLALQSHEAGIRIGIGWAASGADSNTVRNCEVTQTGTGLTVASRSNLITGNSVHDLRMIVNTSDIQDDDYGAVGFWIYAPDNEFSYNRCVNCGAQSYDYGSDGGVFEIYNNGDNSYIHHNWAENSNGFLEVGGGTARHVRLAYNVSYNNGGLACLHTNGMFGATILDVRFENNTVVQTSGGDTLIGCMSGFTSDMISLRNNNIYTSGRVFSNQNFLHTNNIYRSNPGYGLDPSEKIADPLMVDVAGKDFQLQPTSPAIDFGAVLGYAVDLGGTAVPQGAAPDVGAYERQLP